VIVHVGSILHAYTDGRSEVEAGGNTVRAVLDDLEARYPGIRFRIVDEQDRVRPHVRIFVGQVPAADLDTRIGARDQLHVLAALSGG